MSRLTSFGLAVLLTACGCAPTKPYTAAPRPPVLPATSSPPVTPQTTAPPPAVPAPAAAEKAPTEVDRILSLARPKIPTDPAGAAREIARARAAAGTDTAERYKVVYAEATALTYKGDYEGACRALLAFLAEIGDVPSLPIEFEIHNVLMMLRQAQGDVPSAMIECDQETLAGLRGTWPLSYGEAREQKTWLKDTWHRAYLHRMFAERLTGSRRDAAIRYAEAARRAYTELARAMPTHQDSIAVLDGYFAALDGNRDRALAAGRRIDASKNDDVEDLYMAAIALDAGGDKPAAEAIRKKIRAQSDVYIAMPIMQRWMERDARPRTPTTPVRFTPYHPTGAPDPTAEKPAK